MQSTNNWKETFKKTLPALADIVETTEVFGVKIGVSLESFIQSLLDTRTREVMEIIARNKLNLPPLPEHNIPNMVANKMQESRNQTCKDIADEIINNFLL